jgi:hypothetical protein
MNLMCSPCWKVLRDLGTDAPRVRRGGRQLARILPVFLVGVLFASTAPSAKPGSAYRRNHLGRSQTEGRKLLERSECAKANSRLGDDVEGAQTITLSIVQVPRKSLSVGQNHQHKRT